MAGMPFSVSTKPCNFKHTQISTVKLDKVTLGFREEMIRQGMLPFANLTWHWNIAPFF